MRITTFGHHDSPHHHHGQVLFRSSHHKILTFSDIWHHFVCLVNTQLTQKPKLGPALALARRTSSWLSVRSWTFWKFNRLCSSNLLTSQFSSTAFHSLLHFFSTTSVMLRNAARITVKSNCTRNKQFIYIQLLKVLTITIRDFQPNTQPNSIN